MIDILESLVAGFFLIGTVCILGVICSYVSNFIGDLIFRSKK